MMDMCHLAQLVVTTGGTGIAERDVTPEATRSIADKIVDGIGERMRSEGGKKTPLAALSRRHVRRARQVADPQFARQPHRRHRIAGRGD